MRLRLYVVHGSHPCAAVEKALSLKGLDYGVVEWPPTLHAPFQRVIFGARTVPGLKLDGEKVLGSRAIMRRLDQLVPEPPLYPVDPAARARVEEAEQWGDVVFQPIARRLIWPGLRRNPGAMVGFSEGSKIPLPPAAIRITGPAISRVACRLNRTNDGVARAELKALPGHLDRIDDLIAQGTLGDPDHPNAADLQIASTIRLLMTLADVLPLLERRPCAELATQLFAPVRGELPLGTLAA